MKFFRRNPEVETPPADPKDPIQEIRERLVLLASERKRLTIHAEAYKWSVIDRTHLDEIDTKIIELQDKLDDLEDND